jgi:yopX protein
MMIRMRAYDREEQRFLGFEEVKKSLTFADFKNPRYLFTRSTGCYDKNGEEIFEGDTIKIFDFKGSINFGKYEFEHTSNGNYEEFEGIGFYLTFFEDKDDNGEYKKFVLTKDMINVGELVQVQ